MGELQRKFGSDHGDEWPCHEVGMTQKFPVLQLCEGFIWYGCFFLKDVLGVDVLRYSEKKGFFGEGLIFVKSTINTSESEKNNLFGRRNMFVILSNH